MTLKRHTVSVTTDGSGAATDYSEVLSGRLSQIRYVKTDFANGSTFLITAEATGETLWSESNVDASATRAPRQATHTVLGAAALYAGSGVAVLDHIVLAADRVKIVVSSGGATKTGTFYIVVE